MRTAPKYMRWQIIKPANTVGATHAKKHHGISRTLTAELGGKPFAAQNGDRPR